MTFKIGDKVRIIQRKRGNITGARPGYNKPNGNVGEIGIIREIDENPNLYEVGYDFHKGYLGWFDEDDLELYNGEPNYEIY